MARKNLLSVDPAQVVAAAPIIGQWCTIKEQAVEFKNKESGLRLKLVENLFAAAPSKGTCHVKFGDYRLKLVSKLNYKLDYAAFYALAQTPEFAAANIPAEILKPQDPVLNESVYATLSDTQKVLLSNCVTITKASPTLTLEADKPEDAA